MIPKRTLTATLEISTGSLILTSRPPAFQGEVHALALSISLLDGGAAYTPSGNVVAQMYLYWPGTVEMTETVPLTISGSTLTGTLPETLTAVPGCPLLVIQITDADSGDLIVAAASPIQITNVLGGTVISTRPPTPSEIIYVGRSPYIDGVTGNWVQWDTDAGEYVDTGVHAKGDKGDQGIPGPVATVNGVQPDAQGNVQLGDFGGATSSVAGSSGMVPAPAAGDDDMFLRGDGTWAEAGSVKSVNSQTPDNTGDITLSGANIPSSAITGAANVDAGLSALSGQIGDLQDGLAIIVDGDTASVAVPVNGYAYIKNNTHGLTEGLYKNTSSSAFPVSGGTATSSVFTAVSGGLGSELTTLNANKPDYIVGTWTPQLYDLNTYKRDFAEQKYYKIGKLYVMFLVQSNVDYSGITTMAQIRNLPCQACVGGAFYLQGLTIDAHKASKGDYIQPSGNVAYLRENVVSSDFTNASSSALTSGVLFGYDS